MKIIRSFENTRVIPENWDESAEDKGVEQLVRELFEIIIVK